MEPEPCMKGCPSNASEHCDVLCPKTSSCNGAPNSRGEHECMSCCCFPIYLVAYIVTTPFCCCNACSLCCCQWRELIHNITMEPVQVEQPRLNQTAPQRTPISE